MKNTLNKFVVVLDMLSAATTLKLDVENICISVVIPSDQSSSLASNGIPFLAIDGDALAYPAGRPRFLRR